MVSGRNWLSAALGLALIAGPFAVRAAEVVRPLSLEERVAQLEANQTARNQALVDLQFKIAQMQAELRELRGTLEEHGYQLNQLTERQREIYRDVDARLSETQQLLDKLKEQNGSLERPAGQTNAQASGRQEMDAYESIFPLVRAKKYEEAVQAYRQFLSQYPNGKYAVNAHYWLGQVLYVQGKMDEARAEFETVVQKYPKSSKAPDALLKLAMIAQSGEKTDLAREHLERLVREFPNSSAARMAERRLKDLGG
jgi:tol-pal system protein YbgF